MASFKALRFEQRSGRQPPKMLGSIGLSLLCNSMKKTVKEYSDSNGYLAWWVFVKASIGARPPPKLDILS